VREAVLSVIGQTYQNIEIWLIDDASTDNSATHIKALEAEFPQINVILFIKNIGNCKAFNQALRKAKGKYIIDLATDDVMLPHQVAHQVDLFEKSSSKTGVVFANTQLINEKSEVVGVFHQINENGKTTESMPEGNIYEAIVEKSFLSAPSLMFRRDVLEEMNGYDETLSYEDFDIWVRIARKYEFRFLDEIVIQKRILSNSLGKMAFQKNNQAIKSSLRVCQKIKEMNRTQSENQALAKRVKGFLKRAALTEGFDSVFEFGQLLKSLDSLGFQSRCFIMLSYIRFPFFAFYRIYLKLRYIGF
jgi:glycosyltransferase involved in cell wall biosynthesis